MFSGKGVSVVMPAYNEEENIETSVKEFLSSEYVDEVVVVDNNSDDRTMDFAKNAGARVVSESRQGYGFACRRAMAEATGEFILLVEPDGTFDTKDILKFIAYSDGFDMVLGTRTSKEMLWDGANMGYFLRYGNRMLGKLIEILYRGPPLTDVGCTYRLIKKSAFKKIQNKLTIGGSAFSPEMIIASIRSGLKIIEIPVNYKPRRGKSKITGSKLKAFILGLVMIKLIFSRLAHKY